MCGREESSPAAPQGGLDPALPWAGSSAGEAERATGLSLRLWQVGARRPTRGAAPRAVQPLTSWFPSCAAEELEHIVSHGLRLSGISPSCRG